MNKLFWGITAAGTLFIEPVLVIASVDRIGENITVTNKSYINSKTKDARYNLLVPNDTDLIQQEESMKHSLNVLKKGMEKYGNNEDTQKQKKSWVSFNNNYKELENYMAKLKLDRRPLYNLIEQYKANGYSITITDEYTNASIWREDPHTECCSIYELIDSHAFKKYLIEYRTDPEEFHYKIIDLPILTPDVFTGYHVTANDFRNLILLSDDYSNNFNFNGVRSIYKDKNPLEKHKQTARFKIARVFTDLIQDPCIFHQFSFKNTTFKDNKLNIYIKKILTKEITVKEYIKIEKDLNEIKNEIIRFFGIIYYQIYVFMQKQSRFDEFKESRSTLFDASAWEKDGIDRTCLQYLVGWKVINEFFVIQTLPLIGLIHGIVKNDTNHFLISLKKYITKHADPRLDKEKDDIVNIYFNRLHRIAFLTGSLFLDINVIDLNNENIEVINKVITFLGEQLMNIILCINAGIYISGPLNAKSVNTLFEKGIENIKAVSSKKVKFIWTVADDVKYYSMTYTYNSECGQNNSKENLVNRLKQSSFEVDEIQNMIIYKIRDIINAKVEDANLKTEKDKTEDTDIEEKKQENIPYNKIPHIKTLFVQKDYIEEPISPLLDNNKEDKFTPLTVQDRQLNTDEIETDTISTDTMLLVIFIDMAIFCSVASIIWALYLKLM
ncbi:hypothetical protein NEIRO03_0586 [Nematocida sp. AWRm78]|nr:hypothetical protein NEIRO02_0549 [Nematocida sp. AWRm79]KAI5182951.1 hypothetical protein NEIRO03_0586 [Nematocida sp. AWRm78]